MNINRDELQELKKKIHVYLNLGRFDTAEKLLKTGLVEYGPLANLHNLLGSCYHKQGKFPESIIQFKKAIEINPNFIEAGINLSATFCDLSRYEDAEKVFSNLKHSVDPKNGKSILILGKIANSHAETGKLYEEAELIDAAIKEYTKALDLYSPMPDIQLRLGQLYFISNNFQESHKVFEKLLNQNPDNSEARVRLGIVYYKLGRTDLAKQQWEIALKNAPNNQIAKSYQNLSNQWII